MKTSVVKRVVALALAALIVLGTLGYFFSVVAFGATNGFDVTYKITGKDNNQSNKIAENENVTFEITLKPQSGATEIKGGKIEMDTNNGGFEEKNGFDVTIGEKNSDGNYVFELRNVNYKPGSGNSKKGKLAFRIKKADGSGDLISSPFIVNISECETSSSGDNKPGGDDNKDPEPSLPANMTYTIQKVYRSNGTVTYDPADNTKNDPSINRGSYVDAMVQFSISGVKKADIIENSVPKVNVIVDRGSFRFQSSTDSAIKIERVQETDAGVICHVSRKGLNYTGSGNSLAFTVQSKENKEDMGNEKETCKYVNGCCNDDHDGSRLWGQRC